MSGGKAFFFFVILLTSGCTYGDCYMQTTYKKSGPSLLGYLTPHVLLAGNCTGNNLSLALFTMDE